MNDRPMPRPEILELRPYVQGKSQLKWVLQPVKLSSNESPYGPSPRALQAYLDVQTKLHRYPDGTQQELRSAIAETHGLDERQILCGNGSEEIIGMLIRAYVGLGEELLLSENHFMMCPIYARTQGARVVVARERRFTVNVDELLACVTPQTRMVAIANPNNPTGTYLPFKEIRRLHMALPAHVLLLLDAAYAEYVLEEDYEAGASLVASHENVVMTRTLSKAYGLAGLRIGWTYGPPHVIDVLQRIRTPFNTNRAALAAAAAAVRDQEFLEGVRARNHCELQRIQKELQRLGFFVVPSVTNFYRVEFANLPGRTALAAAAYLEAHGVIPRPLRSESHDNALRLTVGTDEENGIALDVLRAFLES